jgi:hypothetical protein
VAASSSDDRVLIARIAAAERWARERDRTAATEMARRGLIAKFEREVDPDGTLDPAERARRVEHLRRAQLLRASRAAAAARRSRRSGGVG